MVASTTRSLSHFTRNIAFGSASRTAPSNSSLSPFGSLRARSRRSTMDRHSPCNRLCSSTRSPGQVLAERCEYAACDLFYAPNSVHSFQDAEPLVVREQLGGHRLVSLHALPDDLFEIVGPVLEGGPGGGGGLLALGTLTRRHG